jgi:hypothetical protein
MSSADWCFVVGLQRKHDAAALAGSADVDTAQCPCLKRLPACSSWVQQTMSSAAIDDNNPYSLKRFEGTKQRTQKAFKDMPKGAKRIMRTGHNHYQGIQGAKNAYGYTGGNLESYNVFRIRMV